VTGTELRRLRRALGLSQLRFGRRLGLKRNTVIRYEGGKRPIPKAVAGYAVCLAEHGPRRRRRAGRGR
jgi:transcriptional regulator with XRE-family HTH domain